MRAWYSIIIFGVAYLIIFLFLGGLAPKASGQQLAKLVASDAAGDDFGTSVAVSGEHVIVGAEGFEKGNDDAGDRSGSAYVLHADGGAVTPRPSPRPTPWPEHDDHDGQDHLRHNMSGGGDTSGGSGADTIVVRSFQTFPRNIWIFWKQGSSLIENEAALRCIQSWRTRNPNWNLTVVSDTTLPTFIAGKDATLIQSIKSKQSSSDLARVALLERLGGVYADVDVYNVLSLDDWLPQYVEPTGTWVPSMKGRDRPVVSWFIASFPGTDIIREWKQSIFAHARKHGKFQRYFQLHYEFGTLLRTNPSFQTQWAHTPHIDATISSSDTCCTVVLPHGSQVPRVKFRRKGGFMVALTAQAKQMIDSGAIPIIKGSKRLVDTPPQQSVMDYLDLIGTMGSVLPRNLRKVFIDLGANCGNSFHKIKQNPRNKILNGGGWETFLWEANPTLVRLWLRPLAKSDPTITIIPKAASNRSGNASFYLTRGQESAVTKNDFHGSECDPNKGQNPSGASSLLSSVPRAGIPIRVEVVDFAAWLKRMKLRPSDTVVLKIDIEGSEFDVLSNLENTNTICLIDEFLIEWHTSHFKENERDRAFRFRETFSKRFYARCGAQPVVNAWH